VAHPEPTKAFLKQSPETAMLFEKLNYSLGSVSSSLWPCAVILGLVPCFDTPRLHSGASGTTSKLDTSEGREALSTEGERVPEGVVDDASDGV